MVARRLLPVLLPFTLMVIPLSESPKALAQGSAPRGGPFLLAGGRDQDLPRDLRAAFLELAGGKKARIVVIPTGLAHTDRPKTPDEFVKRWQDGKPLSVTVLHTRDRKKANDPSFVKPLIEASAVWFTNGHPDRILLTYRGTLVEKELKKLHARGGLIGGTDSGATVLTERVIHRVDKAQLTEPGLGLLPGLLVDDDGRKGRIAEVVAAHPASIGLIIDPGSAVVIRGKDMRVIGRGAVTVRRAQRAGAEVKVERLKAGARVDLGELR